MDSHVSIDRRGSLAVVRLHGLATEEVFRHCSERIVELMQSGVDKVLYDGRDMISPAIDLAVLQQKLDGKWPGYIKKRAIVVSNCRLAYLSRIAFGEHEHRVFYDDFAAALDWVES